MQQKRFGRHSIPCGRNWNENWLCLLNDGGRILFEVGIYQAEDVAKLLSEKGFEVKVHEDYAGIGRIVEGVKI